MLKRLLVGLILGTVIGAVVAAVLVQGLGMTMGFSTAVFAYLAAAATGGLAGLIAGKPIWASGGRIEAGLKAFFGVLLGLGVMFALRTWAQFHLDLSMLKAGEGNLGDLPAASLPIIGALLSGFFELDNTPSTDDSEKKDDTKDAAKSKSGKKVRVADADEGAEEEEAEEPAAAKKKR